MTIGEWSGAGLAPGPGVYWAGPGRAMDWAEEDGGNCREARRAAGSLGSLWLMLSVRVLPGILPEVLPTDPSLPPH